MAGVFCDGNARGGWLQPDDLIRVVPFAVGLPVLALSYILVFMAITAIIIRLTIKYSMIYKTNKIMKIQEPIFRGGLDL